MDTGVSGVTHLNHFTSYGPGVARKLWSENSHEFVHSFSEFFGNGTYKSLSWRAGFGTGL